MNSAMNTGTIGPSAGGRPDSRGGLGQARPYVAVFDSPAAARGAGRVRDGARRQE